MTSIVDRDGLGAFAPGESPLANCAAALAAAGLRQVAHRAATVADMAELQTSWSKRLGIPARRPAWLLVGQRASVSADEHALVGTE